MTSGDKQPLGRMIYFMAQDIRNIAEKVLAPYELTLEQFQAFKILAQNTGISQRQIGRETNKSPANMTRILDRLEMKSLIVRQADPSDRRVYQIHLTAKGSSLMKDVLEVFERFSVRLHQGISEEMQESTRDTLSIMSANITALTADMDNDPE